MRWCEEVVECENGAKKATAESWNRSGKKCGNSSKTLSRYDDISFSTLASHFCPPWAKWIWKKMNRQLKYVCVCLCASEWVSAYKHTAEIDQRRACDHLCWAHFLTVLKIFIECRVNKLFCSTLRSFAIASSTVSLPLASVSRFYFFLLRCLCVCECVFSPVPSFGICKARQ